MPGQAGVERNRPPPSAPAGFRSNAEGLGQRRAGARVGGDCRHSVRRQQGFSLVEVSIVTAIVLLLAIIGIPAVGAYLVENKVPKAGEELARFILQTKVNAPASVALPYAGIGTRNFAMLARDSSVFSVSGPDAAPIVLHGLGSQGEVAVADVSGGAGFSISLSRVNHVACPSIASVMQRAVDTITVAADGGSNVTLKDASTPYSALAAESACGEGDVNTFVFTVG